MLQVGSRITYTRLFWSAFLFCVDLLFGSRYKFFELHCLLSVDVAWKGEQLAHMFTALLSNSASYPHVFAHKRISLLSLSGLYSTNSRTTETPKCPTPLYSPNNRGFLQSPRFSITIWLFLQTLASYYFTRHMPSIIPGVHDILIGFLCLQFT